MPLNWCPQCKTLSPVPASGYLNDLPTSFYLNRLIELLHIKEGEETPVKCGNCDRRFSVSYCFQCGIFYCELCLISHNTLREKKEHRTVSLKEFQKEDYAYVFKRPYYKRPMICSRPGHQKEELKYYCKECETELCPACVTVDHAGHSLKMVDHNISYYPRVQGR